MKDLRYHNLVVTKLCNEKICLFPTCDRYSFRNLESIVVGSNAWIYFYFIYLNLRALEIIWKILNYILLPEPKSLCFLKLEWQIPGKLKNTQNPIHLLIHIFYFFQFYPTIAILLLCDWRNKRSSSLIISLMYGLGSELWEFSASKFDLFPLLSFC